MTFAVVFTIMDLIDGMKTFVATVETGSFTAAADSLGMSTKLASKYVGQLESHLKVRLLNRTTRSLSLTEAGQKYFEGCRDVIGDLELLELGMHQENAALSGVLRIAAPADFGKEFLVPVAAEFCKLHPDVIIDMNMNDRFVDMVAEGFDIAIRIGVHRDSSLISRLLGQLDIWLVAAPSLLDQHGIPQSLDDLSELPCIQDTNMRFVDVWHFSKGKSEKRIPVKPGLRVNSALSICRLALDGHGIALCPEVFVAKQVANGQLVRLFPDHHVQRSDIRALFSSALHMPERQRRFLDHLVEAAKRRQLSPER